MPGTVRAFRCITTRKGIRGGPALSIVSRDSSRKHPTGAAPGPGRASGRVLVVDDDQALRRAVVRALELEGYDVVGAADG